MSASEPSLVVKRVEKVKILEPPPAVEEHEPDEEVCSPFSHPSPLHAHSMLAS